MNLDLSQTRECWRVVRGKDALTHWYCAMMLTYDENDEVFDEDETTWCGQSFFERTPLSEGTAVTCITCCAERAA